jgi:ribosomal protein L4
MEVKVWISTEKILEERTSDSVFAIEPNNHAVYLDVKHLANQRQGTHKAKES